MRIAIIDDTAADQESLRRQLDRLLKRLSLCGEIIAFDSGRTFLSAARKERFDLVFLDIYMGNENGIDTAKALRLFDKNCLLVFITTSKDHALDGFRVRALHYLVKPYTEEELTSLFDEITARLPALDPYMEISSVTGAVRLRLHEILFAEHYQHQIYIYVTDGRRIVTRKTFREFTADITDERFFLCSRGLIVNLEHVADFDGTDFILENGKRLPVSRSLSKSARLAFGDFLFRKGLQ